MEKNRLEIEQIFVFVSGGKRAKRIEQETATLGSLHGSLPKDARRTGDGIQEGKERDIWDIPTSLSETIHQRKSGAIPLCSERTGGPMQFWSVGGSYP